MSFYPPLTISSVIQKIDYNQLLLPAIQREFVWGPEKIELLFDSIMRHYPVGSLLLWKVQGANKTSHRYYSILKAYRQRYLTHCPEVDTTNLPDFEAILDGQQRLTAIYIGLKGTYAYKSYMTKWRDNEHALPTRRLYLNLSGYSPQDETEGEVNEDGRLYDFQFLTNDEFEQDKENIWFEVKQILNLQGTFKLNQFIKENGWEDEEFINMTLSKLHDVIHVTPIINYYLEEEQDYEKALNIFIRINSGGEKLSYSDLIMSTTIAGWKKLDARQEINNLIDEIWDTFWFDLDKDFILRSYLMIFSKDIKFRVSNFSVENAREFEKHWGEIRHTIVETFQLIHDFGYAEKYLTSKNAILPIIYYLYTSGKTNDFATKVAHKDDRENIRKWFHAVILHRTFGGQADGVLKIIRDVIKSELDQGNENFPVGPITKRLSRTRKSITIDDEFIELLLEIRCEDRYSFPVLALLYPHLDFKNGNFHKDHLHPISWFSPKKLKRRNIDTSTEKGWYYQEKYFNDGVVNLQLLDGNENKSKNNKSLADWIKSEEIDLKKYMIPDILEFKRFSEFVDARWEILKTRLKEELTFK